MPKSSLIFFDGAEAWWLREGRALGRQAGFVLEPLVQRTSGLAQQVRMAAFALAGHGSPFLCSCKGGGPAWWGRGGRALWLGQGGGAREGERRTRWDDFWGCLGIAWATRFSPRSRGVVRGVARVQGSIIQCGTHVTMWCSPPGHAGPVAGTVAAEKTTSASTILRSFSRSRSRRAGPKKRPAFVPLRSNSRYQIWRDACFFFSCRVQVADRREGGEEVGAREDQGAR
jgi:hypothetical protein